MRSTNMLTVKVAPSSTCSAYADESGALSATSGIAPARVRSSAPMRGAARHASHCASDQTSGVRSAGATTAGLLPGRAGRF